MSRLGEQLQFLMEGKTVRVLREDRTHPHIFTFIMDTGCVLKMDVLSCYIDTTPEAEEAARRALRPV